MRYRCLDCQGLPAGADRIVGAKVRLERSGFHNGAFTDDRQPLNGDAIESVGREIGGDASPAFGACFVGGAADGPREGSWLLVIRGVMLARRTNAQNPGMIG
jgi:hypothetical protein